MTLSKARLIGQAYLLLALLQGLLVLAVLLNQPSESGQAVLFGFSATRLGLAAATLALLLGWAFLLLASFVRRSWFDRQLGRLAAWLSRPIVWGWALVLSLAGFFTGLYLLMLTPEVSEPYTRVIFERLQPLFLYVSGLCAQNLLVLGALRFPLLKENKRALALFLGFYLVLVGLVFLPWLWVMGTLAGQPDHILGWNELGVPIMETQVFLALLLALGAATLFTLRLPFTGGLRLSRRLSPRAIDWIIAIGIWLLAASLWNSTPITPNWFVSQPRSPNFEYYPNSDALGYDLTSQIMLVGEGYHFVTDLLSHRPIHTLYLTLVHAVAGQSYPRVVFFQILLLAFFPVLVYLLTRKLSNRLAGLLAALLIILREANSIAAAGIITSSHVKSLMVDLPGAVAIVLLLLLLARWLENPRRRLLDLLLAGGVWGMLVLLRQEFAGLALSILLALLIAYWRQPRQVLKGGLVFALGALLVLSPWLWRNTKMVDLSMGDLIRYQTGFLRFRYSANTSSTADLEAYNRSRGRSTPTPLVPALGTPFPRQPFVLPSPTPTVPEGATFPLAREGTAAPTALEGTAVPTALEGTKPLTRWVDPDPAPLRVDLAAFLESIGMHTVNSQDQLPFYLPGSLRPFDSLTGFVGHQDPQRLWAECCSLKGYLRRLPYWHKWDGRFPTQSLLPLLTNLFLLAVGFWVAWKSPRRLAALLPLLFALNYFLVNAAIQNSGGRYILPVDWVSLMYFSIGLATVTWGLIGLVRGKSSSAVLSDPDEHSFQRIFVTGTSPAVKPDPRLELSLRNAWMYLAMVALLLIGSALPLLESAIPQRYTPAVQAAMLANLLSSEQVTTAERTRLEDLLTEPGAAVYAGRALYPRYFRSGEGEVGSHNPLLPGPYARLGFILAGPESHAIVMPLAISESQRSLLGSAWLPHTADVLVITDVDYQAVAVAVFDRTLSLRQLLLRSALPVP